MYKRILVPLDGSELAEQVLPYVRTLAKGCYSQVELLRVFERPSRNVTAPAQVIAHMRGEAEDYLSRIKKSIQDDGVPVSCEVHEGDPPSYIISEAAKEPTTLIAMSTHGRSGLGQWVIGSVADKVLHATTNPMLVVRSKEQKASTPEVKLKTVIVPLDGSSLAEQALPHVVALAKALTLDVIPVQVTPRVGDYYLYMEFPLVGYEDFSKEVDLQALEYLRSVCQKLLQQKVPSAKERLLHGRAADAIVDLVQEIPDSLVAMTTHGRSGLGRWVLGSVADRVVRSSGGPVLLIRAV